MPGGRRTQTPKAALSADSSVSPDAAHSSTPSPASRLEPLRTKAEVETRRELVNVYICKIPTRATGEMVQATKNIAGLDTIPLLHLRRVAKNDFVPPPLQRYTSDSKFGSRHASTGNGIKPKAPATQLILLSPTSLISRRDLERLLAWTTPFLDVYPPKIHVVPVPKFPPTSPEHAAAMCQHYWPTVYNNTNPFGPHPSLVTRSTSQMSVNAAEWMALARKVGKEASLHGLGVGVGAVIVERLEDGSERVVSVAGDARWSSPKFRGTKGDPSRHAIMRAVALVAEKRLRVDSDLHRNSDRVPVDSSTAQFPSASSSVSESPLSELETEYFERPDTLMPRGYLCLNLHVYVTHEPCLCCSMAILHSRVGGAVFGVEMPDTGGLRAESGVALTHVRDDTSSKRKGKLQDPRSLKYGLFWRDDLNWKFHAWQWRNETNDDDDGLEVEQLPSDLHV